MGKRVLVVLAALVALAAAKQFEKCELVRELRKQGFPEPQMRDWVCLVEKESGFRTDAIGKLNGDSSWDHGLFQVNDRYWCTRDGPPGLECNVSCAALRTDDITAAATCVKKIFARHGFAGWTAWKAHCQGAKPDISNC
ncbi:lysozyme-like [Cydia fagiglandana]|uniref:lysozyme-like n=1 Tax=Cydia fagiglandana TaxID=1458189 RepID=UPI002FEE575E